MRTGAVHREALSLTKLRTSFCHPRDLGVITISNDPSPRFPEKFGGCIRKLTKIGLDSPRGGDCTLPRPVVRI